MLPKNHPNDSEGSNVPIKTPTLIDKDSFHAHPWNLFFNIALSTSFLLAALAVPIVYQILQLHRFQALEI